MASRRKGIVWDSCEQGIGLETPAEEKRNMLV